MHIIYNLNFIPTLNYTGAASLTVLINDQGNAGIGGPLTTSNIINMTINPNSLGTNTLPAINNLAAVSANTFVGNEPIVISNSITLTDALDNSLNSGLGNYNDTQLTISRVGAANAQDVFSFGSMSGITVNGNTLMSSGNIIANFTNANGTLQIEFVNTGTIPTRALVNEVIQAVQYSNSSSAPPSSVNLSYVFNDGSAAGNASIAMADTLVNIVTVNQAPVILGPTSVTVNAVTGNYIFGGSNSIQVSDVDADGGVEKITLTATSGTVSLGSTYDVTILSIPELLLLILHYS